MAERSKLASGEVEDLTEIANNSLRIGIENIVTTLIQYCKDKNVDSDQAIRWASYCLEKFSWLERLNEEKSKQNLNQESTITATDK